MIFQNNGKVRIEIVEADRRLTEKEKLFVHVTLEIMTAVIEYQNDTIVEMFGQIMKRFMDGLNELVEQGGGGMKVNIEVVGKKENEK